MVFWFSGILGLIAVYLILCILLGLCLVWAHYNRQFRWDNGIRPKHPFRNAIRNANMLEGWKRYLGYLIFAIFAIPFFIYWIGTLPYDRKHGVKEED